MVHANRPVPSHHSDAQAGLAVAPRLHGGCDSVNVQHDLDGCAPGTTEIRQGSHLLLQTPFLKHRQRLPLAEAERCCRHLLQDDCYQNREPLF